MSFSAQTVIRRLYAAGYLTPLGLFFAEFITRHDADGVDEWVALTAALLSESNQQGDVCLVLDRLAGQSVDRLLSTRQDAASVAVNIPVCPELEDWLAFLKASSCVGQPGDNSPMILDGTLLYLGRYWQYEHEVAEAINTRTRLVSGVDYPVLGKGLEALFGAQPDDGTTDWQKLATAIAVTRHFAVISGGPGTGKTTTVIKVLALLLQQNPDMQIQLAAPTGKAAARMVESIRLRKQEVVSDPETARLIPDSASTLHRLLAYDGRRFRHDRSNPLGIDCLVIDEASMIDLALMARLVSALPADCRIILLGDRDQLASVEAGSVLGDITGQGRSIAYGKEQLDLLKKLTGFSVLPQADVDLPPVADCIGLLKTSYRFRDDSRLGRLARAVNAGDAEQAVQLLNTGESMSDEIFWLSGPEGRVHPDILAHAAMRYTAYLQTQDPGAALQTFNQFRVLCAMHEGETGDRQLNQHLETRLQATGLLSGTGRADGLYHGKPVMITSNDYELNLFNGDTGLAWDNGDGELRVWFYQLDGSLRSLPADSLPQWLPAWALTIHKSQGSEFDEVVLVLPTTTETPLLCRELVYTGITRARSRVLIHSNETVLRVACSRQISRASGLAARLGW